MDQKPLQIDFIVSRVPSNMLRLLRGAAAYARQRGNCIVKQWTMDELHLPSLRGDGMLCEAAPRRVLQRLARLKRPLVKIYEDTEGLEHLPTVALEEREIGRMGARHLIERGLRNLAFYGCDLLWSVRREDGFEQEARAAGANIRSTFHYRARTYAPWMRLEDIRFAQDWITTLPLPAGIMGCDDELAFRLAEACHRAGLRVPDDVAILGVDNNEVACEYGSVPLSSVDPDLERTGFEAAALLDRIIQKPFVGRQVIYVAPRGVVVRQSSEVLAISDVTVRRAMQMIQSHAAQGITAGRLSQEIGVSRRLLERRFKLCLGYSPGQAVCRERARVAQLLMLGTELSLTRIAHRCGFSSSSSFSVGFRRATGCTPQQYRLRHRRGSLNDSGPPSQLASSWVGAEGRPRRAV